MPHVPHDIPLATWVTQLIREDAIYKFYKTDEWIELRNAVMRDAHNECQHCLKHGIYKRADMVHHINEVRKRPDLALTREYMDSNEKIINLVALCNSCHEKEHDRFEKKRVERGISKFTNCEKW